MSAHGILLIDKPEGLRSRRAVDKAGRALGVRKVGHAGTLDPAATGLLILLIGEGTKLSPFLMGGDKRYRATIRLGADTDTCDADGETIAEYDTSNLSAEQVRKALASFRGKIEQVPPQVAAVKVGGRAAWRYARAGESVDLAPRTVTIHELEVVRMELPDVEIELSCTKGTYVRAIARDLGQLLGVGGHLTAIRRIASDPWHIRDAVDFNEFLELPSDAQRRCVVPLERALPGIVSVRAGDDLARAVANGGRIMGEMLFGRIPNELRAGDLIQIVTPTRLAILRLIRDVQELGPAPWSGTEPVRYERVLHREHV
ncbi:MAG: tRNA pseudouridine(55) synthase TruB [Candidatus Dadabacteria bacterium]|nr:MAG: tRNA pseudouridine(55) synthase TruB [Candidatus Dadabacteria bacterium]